MRCLKRIARWICTGSICLTVIATAVADGNVEGTVHADDTGAVVPNAIVVVRWQSMAGAGGRNSCLHVDFAVADDRGFYRIPTWHPSVGQRHDIEVVTFVHKPGYRMSRLSARRGGSVRLQRATDDREARLGYLWHINRVTDCHAEEESQRTLLPLKRVLYEEARDLAVTTEEQAMVQTLLAAVEAIEQHYGIAQEPRRKGHQ